MIILVTNNGLQTQIFSLKKPKSLVNFISQTEHYPPKTPLLTARSRATQTGSTASLKTYLDYDLAPHGGAISLKRLANGEIEAGVFTERIVEAQVHAVAPNEVEARTHAASRVNAAESVVTDIIAYLPYP